MLFFHIFFFCPTDFRTFVIIHIFHVESNFTLYILLLIGHIYFFENLIYLLCSFKETKFYVLYRIRKTNFCEERNQSSCIFFIFFLHYKKQDNEKLKHLLKFYDNLHCQISLELKFYDNSQCQISLELLPFERK